MKNFFPHIKFAILLFVVIFSFAFSGIKSAERQINTVDVVFENPEELFVNYEMVNNLLIQNEAPVQNQQKSLINLHRLETQIERHPMISNAEVSVDMLGRLDVFVQQKKPIARVIEQFKGYYIDNTGNKMPLSKNYTARVPLVDNKNLSISIDKVYPLLEKINKDPFLKKWIVDVKRIEGNYVLQSRYHQQKIELGSLEDLDSKLKNMKAFYKYAERDSVISTYKKINLKYHQQVICTK